MAASVDFAYRGIYHVYRADPADASDDVIERLVGETLINHGGLSPSDIGLDDDEEFFGLHVTPSADINHLPTGIHVVWAVGRVQFFKDTSWEQDEGGWSEISLTTEDWSPASNDEIREAELAAGCDLDEYLKPEKGIL